MWRAIVKAPQGGPIFTHAFCDGSVKEILDEIKEGLDLEKADSVTIEFERQND